MAAPPLPVTVDEFKEHLNTTSSTEDTELTLHLQAATNAVEKRIGPMVVRSVTERVVGGFGVVVLRSLPVDSVTSLTEVDSGTVVDVADLDVLPSGIVRRKNGSLSSVHYSVVYDAGRGVVADVPAHLKVATMIVGKHLWETQRGRGARSGARFGSDSGAGGGMGDATAAFVYGGFALPKRALELLAGDELPGFA